MKLIKIEGNLEKLTRLQSGWSKVLLGPNEANRLILKRRDPSTNGTVRLLADGVVRADATAVIEFTGSNGLPRQQWYDIYFTKKGYYSKVSGSRVYLHELEWE